MERDSSPRLDGDPSEERPEPIPDPFGDLFAADPDAEEGADGERETAGRAAAQGPKATPAWVASLPRFTGAQARLSDALAAASPSLAEEATGALARALGRYTNHAPEEIEFAPLGLREAQVPTAHAAEARGSHPHVYAALTVEPGAARVFAELSATFAAAVVDRTLGGEGAEPDSLRTLSTTELAVVEFLWLALARELNETAGGPLWRVDGVGATPPWHADGRRAGPPRFAAADATTRMLVAPVRVGLGALSGLTNFYLDAEALRALDAAENPLLRRARRREAGALTRFVRDVAVAALVGETELSGAEVAQLEAGDVVLVTRPFVEHGGGLFAGRLRLAAGAGGGLSIFCDAVAPAARGADGEAGGAAAGLLTCKVITVAAGGTAPTAERSQMDQEQLNEDEPLNEEALAALMLTVRVELAARRMSLDELTRLRPGQLIDLGVRPTDPVNLVYDDQRVARGELVDFEGRLGVRITQVP
jgi:type III secretion system YscQ/HrcQ family protein